MYRPLLVVRLSLWLALVVPLAFGSIAAYGQGTSVLRVAWIAAGTGELTAAPRHPPVDTPVDLQLVSAAAERAGFGVVFMPMGRAGAEAALAGGGADVLFPATHAAPPATLAYRTKRDVLLCARDLSLPERSGLPSLTQAYERGWRIAIVRDAPYGSEIQALAEPRADQTPAFGNAALAIAAIVEGKAQCVLAPRLALLDALAAVPAAEAALARSVVDVAESELYLHFAASVPPDTVAAFRKALQGHAEEGTADEIEAKAARPILFRFAVAAPWFSWFDMIGTVAFALSGVLIARSEGFSLLGAFVLAGLPAVGGGVMRDLLVDRDPIGILASPVPLLLVVGTVIVAYLVGAAARRLAAARKGPPRRWPKALSPAAALEVTDAVGLATFTVIGVSVAVRSGAEPLWLWGPFLAALSGAGGGILRDLLRSGYENPALRTSFYAEVCVLWGLALSLAILFLLPDDKPAIVRVMVVLAVLGAFATRLTVVALKVRSPRF